MVNTEVSLCGIKMDNPVIAASGTFGYGKEFAELYDINILGSFSFKGTTAQPRFGNPTPRIAECASGMLNSVGLQNPGYKTVTEKILPEMKEYFRKPVMANVGGFSTDEYAEVCEAFGREPQIGWIEVNISCPNLHGGGMSFGTDPRSAEQVTKAVRRVTDKPIIIKLTPNVTDIASVARACESAGADGISLINTLLGMRIDPRTRRPVLANVTGGVSGPCVFPVALRAVWQAAKAVKIPIVGMGGVSSARDVIEMMLAGATAVGVGAANLTDPFACKNIVEALPEEMKKYGIETLSGIIGACI
ncbi:MAG: dihydroorotate dehydrogenase [Eubacteriales bacterium]